MSDIVFQHDRLTVICGDALESLRSLPSESIQCCVTSPPYWGLRDYGNPGQLGLEKTPEEYVAKMVAVFQEVRRVLKVDGTLWLNLGDSYFGSWGNYSGEKRGQGESQRPIVNGSQVPNPAYNGLEKFRPPTAFKIDGLKPKDLVGIPWMVAFALRADGWYLRQDIIWSKPNPMPESVTDRCTKAHEYLFMLTKSARYFYDSDAIKQPSAASTKERGRYGWNGKTADAKGALTVGARSGSTYHDMKNGKLMGETGMCGDTANKRSVWEVPTNPYPEAHFATYPPALITPCILAGSAPGDTILDPFAGSGTTGMVALNYGRRATLIEMNPDYCNLIKKRCDVTPGFEFA